MTFAEIKNRLAPRMEELCRELLPNGTRDGTCWRVGNIAGDRGQSLEVELQGPKAGLWLDRAGSDKGDVIDLIAQARRISKGDALRWAHEFLGLTPPPPKATVPKPVDPLTFKHPRRPEPATAAWAYRDAEGQVVAYVVRFDFPPKPGKTDPGKDVLPFRWLNGKWRQKGWKKDDPEQSPLYNLPHLVSRPTFPVLLVEGEKTAEAALRIFPTRIVTTWQGGSKAFAKADVTPLQGRDVVFWPDADEPGLAVVDEVLAALPQARVVDLPPGLPDGWDLADPVPNNIDVVAIEATARKAAPRPPKAPMLPVSEATPRTYSADNTVPAATVASESILFSAASKSWWVRTSAGCFVEMDRCMIAKELARLGIEPKQHKNETLSEIDQFLLRTVKDPVAYSGPLAGRRAGPIDHPNGRILVTQPCRPLQGIDAPCPDILEWLHQLTGRDERQFHTLLFWLHLRRRALLNGTWRAGQLLVLAGPAGCGKSFLQSKIITPLLGGRVARPYRYMAGGTEFNAELFAAEHLSIEDESPARDLASRRALGNHIKLMLFAEVQSCHPKGRTAINIAPIWAISLSVNEEPENLMVLPPIDDTLADKLIILKCRKPEPPPGHTEEMQALLLMVDRELPAFAHFVDRLTIPHDYAEPRTGLRHYHNAEIVQALQGLSPEAKLDQLITVAFFQDSTEWEGKALELETALTRRDAPWHHEAQRLFTFNTACGVYLARLATAMPDRYRKRIVHGDPRWRILAPKSRPSPYEPE